MNRAKLILALVLSAILGVGVDFFVNGVLKIIWVGIYGAVYVTIGATLYNYALSTRWRSFGLAVTIATGFLLGTACGHVAFEGRSKVRNYEMNLVSTDPILLQSPDFSDGLFVSSDRLQAALAGKPSAQRDIPVTVQVIQSYGCIQSFKVASVAGVDVISDPQASWVWKPVPGTPVRDIPHAGMKEENQRLIWCRIQWF